MSKQQNTKPNEKKASPFRAFYRDYSEYRRKFTDKIKHNLPEGFLTGDLVLTPEEISRQACDTVGMYHRSIRKRKQQRLTLKEQFEFIENYFFN